MSEGHKTTVTITRRTWHRLKDRKELGQSLDDVINKVLDEVEKHE